MKKYSLLLSIVALMISCTDFLSEKPSTTICGESLLANEAAAEAAINGVYANLNSVFMGNPLGTYLGNASKTRVWTGNRRTDQYEQCHYMTFYSTTNDNKNLYSSLYVGVNACNNILWYLPSSPIGEDYKDEIAGEARFLRAVFYFTLARVYGDVPVIQEPVTEESQVNVPRSPYQKVYRFILDDLDFAESNMRDYARQTAVNGQESRACQSAVHAVRAMVYTWIASYMSSPYDQFFDASKPGRYPDFTNCGVDTPEEAWTIVLRECEALMAPDSPYALEPDYRNLFRWDPQNHPEDYRSKERILVTSNTPYYGPTSFMQQLHWPHPAESISMTGTQSIAGRTRPARWVWEKWCEKYGNTPLNSKGWHEASPDPRQAVTYQSLSYTYWDQDNYGQVKTKSGLFPNTTGGTSSNHYFRKWISHRYDYNTGDADCYIIRMAEVYLMAAEAAARLDDLGKAVGYVNKLLDRARRSVDNPSSPAAEPADWTVGQFASTEDFVDAVMLERLFEMHGENHEWFDTHRLGAAWLVKNISQVYIQSINLPGNASVKSTMELYATPTPSDVESVRKSMICAFPDYELRNNVALNPADQNDFYWR